MSVSIKIFWRGGGAGIDRGPGEGRGTSFSRAPYPAKRRSNPDVAGAGVDVILRDCPGIDRGPGPGEGRGPAFSRPPAQPRP